MLMIKPVFFASHLTSHHDFMYVVFVIYFTFIQHFLLILHFDAQNNAELLKILLLHVRRMIQNDAEALSPGFLFYLSFKVNHLRPLTPHRSTSRTTKKFCECKHKHKSILLKKK